MELTTMKLAFTLLIVLPVAGSPIAALAVKAV
jgi:hypothetical protein